MKVRNTATITIQFTSDEEIARTLTAKAFSKLNYREIFLLGVEVLEAKNSSQKA